MCYQEMPPKNFNSKRREQNIDTFTRNTDYLVNSASSVVAEYGSFLERLRGIKANPAAKGSLDDLSDSIARVISATERLSNSISAHSLSFAMVARSVDFKATPSPASQIGPAAGQSPSPLPQPPAVNSRRARPRRASRQPSETPSSPVGPIKEEDAADPESRGTPEVSVLPPTPVEVTTPVPRARRRRGATPSYTPSVAGTEYTDASGTRESAAIGGLVSMSPIEKVHIRQIGDASAANVAGGSTYQEMLQAMVDSGVVASALCKSTLEYVRERMAADLGDEAEHDATQRKSGSV
ncbi:hypothetical protein SLS56_010542 [Neofusicoccum ribis]|uniref:Uncharacterized protein n=1 Tax=Neofusicoccum ribis TaxID=45134 RepID=A0ABR3SE50_9PEZI